MCAVYSEMDGCMDGGLEGWVGRGVDGGQMDKRRTACLCAYMVGGLMHA